MPVKKKEGKKGGKEGYRNELRKKGEKEKEMQTALLPHKDKKSME